MCMDPSGSITLVEGCSELLILLSGTTSVFWGMHLSGAMGLPRRMPDAPDMYMHAWASWYSGWWYHLGLRGTQDGGTSEHGDAQDGSTSHGLDVPCSW